MYKNGRFFARFSEFLRAFGGGFAPWLVQSREIRDQGAEIRGQEKQKQGLRDSGLGTKEPGTEAGLAS
jgi:hypothetical protein